MEAPVPDYQQFAKMWLDFATRMAAAGAAAAASETVPTEAARQIRDTYFQTLSQYTEEYMRSPQFLKLMKQSTETAIAFRKQANDFLTNAHHAVGGLARPDIDGVLLAVRRCETRVLDKLDELCARISELESRLGPADSGGGKTPRKAK